MTSDRVFCVSSPEAAAMDDGEFWDHVAESILGNHVAPSPDDEEWEPINDLPVSPCGVCGTSETSCGYDEAGRPWVHCDEESSDDQ